MTVKVFLVDDSRDFVSSFGALLTLDGECEVVGEAGSEQAALEWSFENEAGFDVAVVDLLLQSGSGFAVLLHLAKYQPGKVVILSSHVSPAIEERCKKLGAVAAFPKSRAAECVAFIRGLAGGAAQRKQES
jgi:DNA-binding NarL/FixJ family response regulator